MKIEWLRELPYIPVSLIIKGKKIIFNKALLDTGSVRSIFSIDILQEYGIKPQGSDTLHEIVGVGGTELVLERTIDAINLGESTLLNPTIQMGNLDYGFPLEAIVGSDLLFQSQAMINYKDMNFFTYV